MEKKIVRFYALHRDFSGRKGECSVCYSMVTKYGLEGHARYHVDRGEGQDQRPGTFRSFLDITVYGDHTTNTGWRTEDTGPR